MVERSQRDRRSVAVSILTCNVHMQREIQFLYKDAQLPIYLVI